MRRVIFYSPYPGSAISFKERPRMIRVENLTKYYGDVCAVDQISFDVQKGEILGLLGPNGAGKTTTLRMLTGYLNPTAGRIQVGDYSTEDRLLEIKKILGYLPESAPLYHDMLVFDYLRFVADLRGIGASHTLDRIRELGHLCGINEVMHQPIGNLSKGYRQRVGLAHAMMGDPEVLVLDEPTSGLDPNQIVEIREIIRRIGKAKTVIFSTHILSEAEATCDRVVIIHRGKIAADSNTARLKETLGGRSQIHLTLAGADAAEVQQALRSVPGVTRMDILDPVNGAIRLVILCDGSRDPRSDLYHRIRPTNWTLLEFRQEALKLEDIFRQLTKEG
jgi:ABC-2 type transport system ATP-binding protein